MNYYLIQFTLTSFGRENSELRLVLAESLTLAIQGIKDEHGTSNVKDFINLTIETEQSDCDATEFDIY